MAQNTPSTLTDFNTFFEDKSYAGLVNKAELPDIEFMTKDVKGSGTGGEQKKIIKKLKAMMVKATVSGYNNKLLGYVGSSGELTFYGSQNVDGDEKAIKAVIGGGWYKQSTGSLDSSSDDIALEMECSVKKFVLEVDGKEVYYIDLDNNIGRINGKDLFEKVRRNLGAA